MRGRRATESPRSFIERALLWYSSARSETAQGMTEYLVILLTVAVAVLITVRTFGRGVSCQFSNATTQLGGIDTEGCRASDSSPTDVDAPAKPMNFVPPAHFAAQTLPPEAAAPEPSPFPPPAPPPPAPPAFAPPQESPTTPALAQAPTVESPPAISPAPTPKDSPSALPSEIPSVSASSATATATPSSTPTSSPTATSTPGARCFVDCQWYGCYWTSNGCRWVRCWTSDVSRQPSYPLATSGTDLFRTYTSLCESISNRTDCQARWNTDSISWEVKDPATAPSSGDAGWDGTQANFWNSCRRRWP